MFRLLAGDHFCSDFWQETVCSDLAGDRFVPTFGRRPFCSDFWQETVLFRLLAGDHFCSNFWQETVLFRSGRRPFPTFGRRPFCIDLAGDRFQLLAGDHVSIWQETVLFRSGRRPFPTFGRRPFCSIFWQGTILFHLLAGDHFVPSFGRGPFCSIFWQGTVLFHPWQGTVLYFTFLSGTPNVVLDVSSRRHPTRQWSRTRLRRCRHSQTAASCAWLKSQHARLAPLRAMCRSLGRQVVRKC